MSLQAKLDAFKADFEAGKPPYSVPRSFIETMHRATAELIESRAAQRAKKAGDVAPSFSLKDPEGNVVNSADPLKRGPLVLSFYRGVWCPYCNIDLKALEAARPLIEAKGASLVALSMQNARNSRRSARENGLGFPILVDKHGKVADAFGLRFKLSPAVVKVYRDVLKNDLEAFNDDTSWTLPMPARYVIAYAEVNPDFTRRPDPSELFPVLDQLARTRAA